MKQVTYPGYLELDKVLDAQHPKSTEHGKEAHDETLFIVIHQVYELWFKQIIHELSSVTKLFKDNVVDEKNIGIAVSRLNRIREIQKILIDQIRVLETMTPLDFFEFRDYIVPASGFQSLQFRKIETMLGLEISHRVSFNNKKYYDSLIEQEKKEMKALEKEDSLLDLINNWLERTPFLSFDDFDFLAVYHKAIQDRLAQEKEVIQKNTNISDDEKPIRIKMLEESLKQFEYIFDKNKYNELVEKGERQLSYESTLAVLFINLYRDQPILQLPFKLLSDLVDIDELFTTWRHRHALMVLRIIGRKVGTGGSSGHDYLNKTAEQHKIFKDLYNISTLLIPRSFLPDLPKSFEKRLGFYYTFENKDQ